MGRTTATTLVLTGHTGTVTCCAFSPDGTLLATSSGDWDKTVRLWDPASGHLVRVLEQHADWVHGCAFSPDGTLLVTVSSGWTVRLWDPMTGRERTRRSRLRRQARDAVAAAVTRGRATSPDGALLAVTSGGWDPVVRVLDARTGDLRHALRGHTGWVHGCAFSPDGRLLATTGGDATARLWDPCTGAALRVLDGHAGWVTSGAFSPDGATFATTSNDQTARIWSLGDG